MGIGGKIFDSIQAIYSDLKCKVKVVTRVVILSQLMWVSGRDALYHRFYLYIYSAYVNDLMEELRRENVGPGIEVNGIRIPGLMFADDICIVICAE